MKAKHGASEREALRREYNAAVANGMVLTAMRLAKRLDHLESGPHDGHRQEGR